VDHEGYVSRRQTGPGSVWVDSGPAVSRRPFCNSGRSVQHRRRFSRSRRKVLHAALLRFARRSSRIPN